jgi:cytochrome b561
MPFARTDRYSTTAIAFHWLMFALVVCVGTLGLLHDSWPDKASQRFWINIHALIGLLLWLLLFARLGWRLRHAPPPAAGGGPLQRRLRGLGHFTLYALLFVIPIVGMVTFVYHGRIFNFGVFSIDLHVASNRAVFHPTEEWHGYLAYALFGFAALHALIALWHQFVLRDGLLARMWPRAHSVSDAPSAQRD